MPITESYERTVKRLETTPITNMQTQEQFNLQLTTLIKENIQARDRGARLIAASAQISAGAFSCNSNKTEISIGYATFYGDIAGAADHHRRFVETSGICLRPLPQRESFRP